MAAAGEKHCTLYPTLHSVSDTALCISALWRSYLSCVALPPKPHSVGPVTPSKPVKCLTSRIDRDLLPVEHIM